MHPEDFLSLEEWHSLLKAAQSTGGSHFYGSSEEAGLRVSEVAALKVEHFK
jgi:integrase